MNLSLKITAFYVGLAFFSAGINPAEADTAFYEPDADIQTGWTPSAAGSHYLLLDDGARSPSTPSTADYVTTDIDADTDEWGFAGVTETGINRVTGYLYVSTGNKGEINLTLEQSGVSRASTTVAAKTGQSWTTMIWNSPSGDLSDLSVSAEFNQTGNNPQAAAIYAAYLEIDYIPPTPTPTPSPSLPPTTTPTAPPTPSPTPTPDAYRTPSPTPSPSLTPPSYQSPTPTPIITPSPTPPIPVSLFIEPVTWNVVGLDSNKVQDGPNVFPAAVRVWNTGTAPALVLRISFSWDATASYINLVGRDSLEWHSLAPGTYRDFHFNVELTRDSAAYDTSRLFHIDASAWNADTVSTSSNREIYIEHLVSQNRNSVTGFSGDTEVVVGDIVEYEMYGSTATNGYEQIEIFVNFPNTMFNILTTRTVWAEPPGSIDEVYADGCGWDNDITSPDYLSCVGPCHPLDCKFGGIVTVYYSVEAVGAGSTALTGTIYDFSGSSYHYNSDYGTGINSYYIIVNPSPTPPPLPTLTPPPTPSVTPTPIGYNTPTPTPSTTPTPIGFLTPSPTASVTPSPTPIPTATPSSNCWWTLDFQEYPVGTEEPTDGTWTVDTSDLNLGAQSYFSVQTEWTVFGPNHFFSGRDIDGIGSWTSETIDITTYEDITISTDIAMGSIAMEQQDYIRGYYSLDGGPETEWFSQDGDLPLSNTWYNRQTGDFNGSTLRLTYYLKNNESTEIWKFDDIRICRAPPTPTPSLTPSPTVTPTVTPLNPTAINLTNFSARAYAGVIAVEWKTGFETDNLGFNIYRSPDRNSSGERINSALILGLGSSPSGGAYLFLDREAEEGRRHYFRLEAIDIHGKSEFYGPVAAETGKDTFIYDHEDYSAIGGTEAEFEPTPVPILTPPPTPRLTPAPSPFPTPHSYRFRRL